MKRIIALIILTLIHVFVRMAYPTNALYKEDCPFFLKVLGVFICFAWITIFVSLIAEINNNYENTTDNKLLVSL